MSFGILFNCSLELFCDCFDFLRVDFGIFAKTIQLLPLDGWWAYIRVLSKPSFPWTCFVCFLDHIQWWHVWEGGWEGGQQINEENEKNLLKERFASIERRMGTIRFVVVTKDLTVDGTDANPFHRGVLHVEQCRAGRQEDWADRRRDLILDVKIEILEHHSRMRGDDSLIWLMWFRESSIIRKFQYIGKWNLCWESREELLHGENLKRKEGQAYSEN